MLAKHVRKTPPAPRLLAKKPPESLNPFKLTMRRTYNILSYCRFWPNFVLTTIRVCEYSVRLFEYATIRLFECALCGGVAAQHGHLTVQPWVIFGYASLKVLSSSCQSGLCGSWLPTPRLKHSCSSFGPGPAAAFNCHLDFQAHVCSTRSFFSFVRQKRICSEMARKNAAKTIANAEDDDWLPDLNANVGNVHCGVKELAGFSTEIVLSKLLKSLFISFWL